MKLHMALLNCIKISRGQIRTTTNNLVYGIVVFNLLSQHNGCLLDVKTRLLTILL